MTVAIVVSDTSPIRALSHIKRLDLLQKLFGEVLIPPAVVAELERSRSKLAPIAVQELSFVRIRTPEDRDAVRELEAILGPGEAEALVLAEEIHADAILIDERAGRAVARRRGLRPVGVLGILLRAKRRKLVAAVGPLLDLLQQELGFFISSSVRADVLRQAGE